MSRALVVVDMLNDFVNPQGSLPVPDATSIIAPINSLALYGDGKNKYKVILSMEDNHKEGHCSFKQNGGDYPPHCVQGTPGREIHKDLRLRDFFNIHKGSHDDAESYGGFYDDKRRETEALAILRMNNISEIHVVGVATEFCVKETVLQSLEYGFDTMFIPECIRGLEKHTSKQAENEMMNAGAKKGELLFSDGYPFVLDIIEKTLSE